MPVLTFSQTDFVPEIQFSCGDAAVTIEVILRVLLVPRRSNTYVARAILGEECRKFVRLSSFIEQISGSIGISDNRRYRGIRNRQELKCQNISVEPSWGAD